MSKLIDLSHSITDDMPVHPYDKKVNLNQNKYLQKDGYNHFRLETGMHAGTHIDSPLHLTDHEKTINEFSLEKFMGKGCVLDVSGESIINYKKRYSKLIKENVDIVLLYTGYSIIYGSESYFNSHPVVSEELAEFFIKKKIKMLGVDLPSPDYYPFKIHKKLLKEEIFIIENLKNLSKLLDVNNFEVMSFPLKVKADASITRVVAKIYDSK